MRGIQIHHIRMDDPRQAMFWSTIQKGGSRGWT